MEWNGDDLQWADPDDNWSGRHWSTPRFLPINEPWLPPADELTRCRLALPNERLIHAWLVAALSHPTTQLNAKSTGTVHSDISAVRLFHTADKINVGRSVGDNGLHAPDVIAWHFCLHETGRIGK